LFFQNKKLKKVILDNYVKSLKELVEYGKRFNVNVMLENAVEKREITSLEDFRYIINRVPGVKVHLDVGHAFIWGGIKNIRNFIMAFEDRIEHIHLHDNHGKSDEHLPIGEGKINWKSVVGMLKKNNYDKTITLEVFSKNRKDVVRSREKIRKLWIKN
jgi:sugar phosphate isomerase/epimerase